MMEAPGGTGPGGPAPGKQAVRAPMLWKEARQR